MNGVHSVATNCHWRHLLRSIRRRSHRIRQSLRSRIHHLTNRRCRDRLETRRSDCGIGAGRGGHEMTARLPC